MKIHALLASLVIAAAAGTWAMPVSAQTSGTNSRPWNCSAHNPKGPDISLQVYAAGHGDALSQFRAYVERVAFGTGIFALQLQCSPAFGRADA